MKPESDFKKRADTYQSSLIYSASIHAFRWLKDIPSCDICVFSLLVLTTMKHAEADRQ